MRNAFKRWWITLLTIVMVVAMPGCVNDAPVNENLSVSGPISTQDVPAVIAGAVCPIPPLGYERMPGYQPDSVDPSLSEKSLAFISPTLEGNPTFYLGILQQPVNFCGIAKDNILNVKLFASGAYIYEEKDPVPAEPELLLGEAQVENGLWFFSYDFREGGVIDILAEGYDAGDQPIATTAKISISLAEPNPR